MNSIGFTLDIRNLDLVKELLECVDKHMKENPSKYKDLRIDLYKIMNKFKED